MAIRIGSFYVGHVDFDNVGLEGKPVNDRRYGNDYLTTVFDRFREMAQLMDRLGYDVIWGAEHHFQHEGFECIPNLPMLFVQVAQVTERIHFGCGFNITPAWHPLRLAEDYAVADILTGGRVLFGVGRGYHTREIETLGSPLRDQAANRDLFEEQMEVILKAFHEPSFSHHGKYYNIPPAVPYRGYELKEITLVPRPRRLPVECWQPIVSATPRGLDFMAKHRIKGLVGGGAAAGGVGGKTVQRGHDAVARAGRETELGGEMGIGLSVHLAATERQAIKELKPWYEEYSKFVAPLGFVPGLTPENIAALGDPARARREGGLLTLEESVKRGHWLVGPPELVKEQVLEVLHRYPGTEMLNVNCPITAPKKMVFDQLAWFARDVMPAIRGK